MLSPRKRHREKRRDGKAGAIHFARKEALAASHAMTSGRACASILRSLTRQMGRSTLGCNQQDLWNTVKGLSARSLPAWFPVAGGGINTAAIYANVHSKLPSLTADPCSATGRLRCISLLLTMAHKGMTLCTWIQISGPMKKRN